MTPDGTASDCFQYHLNSLDYEIISTSFFINSKKANISITIYEIDEAYGDWKYIDRMEIREVVENENIEIGNTFRNWIKSRLPNRMIKLEIKDLFSYKPLDSREVLNSAPHFEVTVFKPNQFIDGKSNCDGCCITPFYVNFTEIGWNDWILYPPGFWGNYCSGSCNEKSDDNYEIMKSLVTDQSLIPKPTCAPNYYGSIDIIIALSSVDIRRTRAHGMRALSCSCL
ncbi:hypothetical protein B9Z55_006593 [Caenorhabditis nigoni]|uniref:TGF-beta family profile domain-containing protein n=2 Tax=Caenorhabditis nigoni TaxID=1611254 RepID=A0A2G5V659_9PELO|nr:hypothetical protein B9Z55_006593 [Caenorhabditis nigoni]